MEGESQLKPGYTLDRYELLCPVGSGGMASVWLARLRGKRGFEKLFAIKTIRSELSEDPRFEEMFLDEARIASGIQHPNVAQVIDLGEQDGVLFTVIEWVDGESLAKVRQHAAKNGAAIPAGLALRIVADACAGLHAAHELKDADGTPLGIVHRDVSPHNILISTAGGVKLIDFGLAKATNRLAPRTQSGLLKGKLEYMAPEQVLGQDVDRRVDVWAMGVCLYEMLAGRRPFAADNQLDLARQITTKAPPGIPDLAEPLRQILIDALAPDPAERFESAGAMRKRCELTLSAMELPSTSEDVAAFVSTHLADRARKRSETVSRALADAARRAGESLPPPPVQRGSTPPPGGVRVSARAMLEQDAAKDRLSGPGGTSSAGVAGSVSSALGAPRPAWVLPLGGLAIGLAVAGVVRWRAGNSDTARAAGASSASAASTTPSANARAAAPSGSDTVYEIPATPSASSPLTFRTVTSAKANAGRDSTTDGGAGVTPHAGTTAAASASDAPSAAPTSTWGVIPPTTPTIWKPPSQGDAEP